MNKFTPLQIKNWKAYETIRASGKYNMLEYKARLATELCDEAFWFCADNFSELKDQAEKED